MHHVHQARIILACAAAPATSCHCCNILSGTTGNPKGVIITHANVVATVSGLHVFLASINEGVTETDCVRMIERVILCHQPRASVYSTCRF